MKTCPRCKTEKPESEFHKNRTQKDGLQSACIDCMKPVNRAYIDGNYEKIRAARKKYRETNQEKIKAFESQRRIKNPEKEKARSEAYRRENSVKIKESQSAYYIANAEKRKAYTAHWRSENPGAGTVFSRNRRAAERKADGIHTKDDVVSIFDSQRGKCANCRSKLIKSGYKKYHVDHIMPLARGGSNDKYNLQCLCPTCNMRKHAKDPIDWAADSGRLL